MPSCLGGSESDQGSFRLRWWTEASGRLAASTSGKRQGHSHTHFQEEKFEDVAEDGFASLGSLISVNQSYLYLLKSSPLVEIGLSSSHRGCPQRGKAGPS